MTPTNPTDALTDGQYEVDDYGSIGEAARRICSFCEGDMRRLVYIIAKEELAATEARAQGLVDAAQAFTDRLKFIHEHEAYKSVWMVNQVHCGPYDGPQYADELEALDQALATWRRT